MIRNPILSENKNSKMGWLDCWSLCYWTHWWCHWASRWLRL